jgi:MoxR-like ATPase
MSNGEVDMTSLDGLLEGLGRARDEIGRSFVGHRDIVDQILVSVMSDGHALLEGAPGLGKTLLVRSLSSALGLRASRIQFTPDLMPADVTGGTVLVHDDAGSMKPTFRTGPIFAQVVLADEINRATPKTQSALLEAMQERSVTVAGTAHALPRPFLVLATQNPIEMEGTYVLPEAQVDRFLFKVKLVQPSEEMLDDILDLTTGAPLAEPSRVMTPDDVLQLQRFTRAVPISDDVRRAIAWFITRTHPDHPDATEPVRRYVRYGVSPRGGQALVLAAKARALLRGAFNVGHADVRSSLAPALSHRLRLTYEAEAEGISPESLLEEAYRQGPDA